MEEFKQILNDYAVSSLHIIDDEFIIDLFVLAIHDDYIRVIDKDTESIYNINMYNVYEAYIKGECTLYEEEVLSFE